MIKNTKEYHDKLLVLDNYYKKYLDLTQEEEFEMCILQEEINDYEKILIKELNYWTNIIAKIRIFFYGFILCCLIYFCYKFL